MASRALLIGASGRLPFTGHLRMNVGDADVAARVAAGCAPTEAWNAVCALHAALEGCEPTMAAMLARVDAVREDLGPAKGEDLALLIVSEDGFEAHNLDETWEIEGAVIGLGAGDPKPMSEDLRAHCG